jgi:hypothetical protein
MEFKGKLYGKLGNKYFDTGKTSQDFNDLIQALQEILQITDRDHVVWDKARKALKKALS